MISALDIHFEVVRNPMLPQQVSKPDGRDCHLPMPMASASGAGHIESTPFRMIFVDPELHLPRLAGHRHVANDQPSLTDGLRKTSRHLSTECLVGLDRNNSETAFEVETRVIPVVHPHIEDEIRGG